MRTSSPYIHVAETTINLHIDLLIGLLAAMVIGVVQNGFRVLALCLLSAFAAWITETIGRLVARRPDGTDLRSIAMGFIIALLCPVTVPIWVPVSASVFSVLFVRVLLGPQYETLFMTPVLAWLYMLSVAPSDTTSYPAVRFFGAFPILQPVEQVIYTNSLAQQLQARQTPSYTLVEILSGNYPGGMGTTCIFVILCVCAYFVFRKSMAWQVSLSMIVTVAVMALIFNRTELPVLFSVLYELTATSYVFVAVFVAGDLINAPTQPLARVAYGICIGLFTMLFRYMGLAEHCVALALFITYLGCELLDLGALKWKCKRLSFYHKTQ